MAQQDLTKQLPLKEAEWIAQEQAADAALHQAKQVRALQACHTLAAPRYASTSEVGPFETAITALTDAYAGWQALTEAHREGRSWRGFLLGFPSSRPPSPCGSGSWR